MIIWIRRCDFEESHHAQRDPWILAFPGAAGVDPNKFRRARARLGQIYKEMIGLIDQLEKARRKEP